MKIKDVCKAAPTLNLEHYFEGKTRGWGFMTGRSSRIEKQFSIEASGTCQADGSLSLTENYQFDDGSVDRLQWSIRRRSHALYDGSETRMIGEARGEQAGNAFHWRYRRLLPGSRIALDFDDWFLLQSDGMLLVAATFGRLGLTFGRLSACYRKDQVASREPSTGHRRPGQQ